MPNWEYSILEKDDGELDAGHSKDVEDFKGVEELEESVDLRQRKSVEMFAKAIIRPCQIENVGAPRENQ